MDAPEIAVRENEEPRGASKSSSASWIARTALASFLLIAVAIFAVQEVPVIWARFNYRPQEGDIIFQSLARNRLVVAIEGVTQSPYSHCAIVARENEAWLVYEAFDGVEATPLKEFLDRGRNRGFVVYRMRDPQDGCIGKMIAFIKTMLGKPYDVRYRMDDDAIYCSELIYKAYSSACREEQLGKLQRLGDLNWKPFTDTILLFERSATGGHATVDAESTVRGVPLDREMITPRALAEADQLSKVFEFRMPSAQLDD